MSDQKPSSQNEPLPSLAAQSSGESTSGGDKPLTSKERRKLAAQKAKAARREQAPAAKPPKKERAKKSGGGGAFWLLFLFLTTLLMGSGIGVAVGYVNYQLEQLPESDYLEYYHPWMPSRIFAGPQRDLMIADFVSEDQKREMVPISEMPQNLLDAVVALEDRRFYQHSGICLPSLIRATYVNLSSWSIQQGASTITIQLAEDLIENGHVAWDIPETSKRSFERKPWEWLLALQIEKRYTKREILEIYLNQVFLGDQVYGVARAAEYYFGKRTNQLTLKECAILAGMLKAPNQYSPRHNYDLSIQRANVVLRVMKREGYITQSEFEDALDARPQLNNQAIGRTQVALYPYYSWSVYRQFANEKIQTPEGQPIKIRGPGIDVISAMDADLQEIARQTLRQGLEDHERRRRFAGDNSNWAPGIRTPNDDAPNTLQVDEVYDAKVVRAYDPAQGTFEVVVPGVRGGNQPLTIELDNPDETWLDDFDLLEPGLYVKAKAYQQGGAVRLRLAEERHVQGALVAVRPSTGEVLALMGGYDYLDEKNNGQYIRALQAVTLQPGSAFKPLLMAAALNDPTQKWNLASILRDEKRQFWRDWAPSNFYNEYYGDVTLYHTLVHSLNASSVWLLDNLKESRSSSIQSLKEFSRNIFDLTIDDSNLAIALGTSGVSPWELAQAYQVLANHGDFIRLHMVDEVYQRQDERSQAPAKLYEFSQPYADRKRLSPQVAYLTTYLLRGVVEEGTADEALELPFWVAGKTGTTDDSLHAWFAGYTSDLLCVVFVGYDDFGRSLGHRMTGSQVALPIWIDFMEKAYEARPELFGEIEPPPGIEFAEICDASGKLANAACHEETDRHQHPLVKRLPFIQGTAPETHCPLHGTPPEDETIRPISQFYEQSLNQMFLNTQP